MSPTENADTQSATLHAAREAIQVSTVYGRQSNRRQRQQQALPSLERLAQTNTRYQKQLDDVRQGLRNLDDEVNSLLRQYTGLVDTLAASPERFERIREKLSAMDLPPAGQIAREYLIKHVEDKTRGSDDASNWRASLDESYASTTLW